MARGRGRALTLIKRQLFARRARGLSRTLGSLTSPGKESDGGSSHKTGTRDTRLDIAGLLRADHAAGMMRALQVSPRQRDSSHLCGTEPLLPPCPGGGGDRVLERGLAHWGRAQCWARGGPRPDPAGRQVRELLACALLWKALAAARSLLENLHIPFLTSYPRFLKICQP